MFLTRYVFRVFQAQATRFQCSCKVSLIKMSATSLKGNVDKNLHFFSALYHGGNGGASFNSSGRSSNCDDGDMQSDISLEEDVNDLNQKVGGNKHSIPFFALPLLKLKICVGRCELFAFFMVAQESIPKCSNSPFNTK